jgi:thiol:disulfide interchange protein
MPKTTKNNEKIHSVFLGRKIKEFYKLNDNNYSAYLSIEKETLERVKLLEVELNYELETGDEIFLHEQGVYAKVQKVTNGTDSKVYYNLSYVVEIIDEKEVTYNELIDQYNILKEKYDKRDKELTERNIENKNKFEKEELEFKTLQKERNDWQKDNFDKIKGIIYNKIPMRKDSESCLLNKEQQTNIARYLLKTVPKEYILINLPTEISYIPFNGETTQIKEVQDYLSEIK